MDGVEALGHRAASVDIGFFGHDNLHVTAPVARLIGRPGAAHAATDDENIAILEYRFKFRHQ
jgi:hypothetical protein